MSPVTLYGLDKKGGFKVWAISVWETSNGEGVITINHGKEGGKQTRKDDVIKAGKQGRNAVEQAEFEATARIKKQMDKGYRADKLLLGDIPLLAMLAQDYNKVGHRIEYPCYVSVKYDGVRALAKKVDGVITLESRTGQLYDLPDIICNLGTVMQDGDVLDGEVYLHGYALQDIVSAVKRTDTQAEVDKAQRKYAKAALGSPAYAIAAQELEEALLIHEIRPKLEFHVFDKVELDIPFETRLVWLDLYMAQFGDDAPLIRKTKYRLVGDEEGMKAAHKAAVGLAYEGLMLRNKKGVYESGKRSADLQKYKEFLDSEFTILDVIEDKDGLAVFVVQNTFADNTFNVIMGTKAQKAGYLRDKSILKGKSLTAKYQSLYKGTLKPQFPTGVVIRDYE